MISLRHLALLAIVAGVILAGLQLQWEPREKPAATRGASNAAESPDLLVEQPFMQHFDETGQMAWQVRGQFLRHHETNNTSLIEQPIGLIRPRTQSGETQPAATTTEPLPLESSNPWQLQARTAILTEDQTHIELNGDARVANQEMDIRSDQLLFDTGRQFARTDKAVTITAHGATAHATGLEADLTNKTLRLPAQVREIHEAPKRKR